MISKEEFEKRISITVLLLIIVLVNQLLGKIVQDT